jgi:hypothetical protein
MAGESLVSCDGRFGLKMQADGNLVLYVIAEDRALWASNTNTYRGPYAIMQGDGNLVLYSLGDYVWDSATNGHPGATLDLQDDGNLVVYDAAGPIWASNTKTDLSAIYDVLWHNGASGATQLWHMVGEHRTSVVQLDASLSIADSTGWRVVGTGDFNLDGNQDILWHNGSSGATQVWYMNGAGRIGAASFDASLNVSDSTGWRIVGIGDFNRDGSLDVLWHNGPSGATQVWYLNGAERTGFDNFEASLSVTDSSGWRVAGVGDFNRDGNPDILWHNGASGATQVWYMSGAKRANFASFEPSLEVADSTGWRIAGVGDFNHDGNADVLWHNGQTGLTQIWEMAGVERVWYFGFEPSLTVADSTGWGIVSR